MHTNRQTGVAAVGGHRYLWRFTKLALCKLAIPILWLYVLTDPRTRLKCRGWAATGLNPSTMKRNIELGPRSSPIAGVT